MALFITSKYAIWSQAALKEILLINELFVIFTNNTDTNDLAANHKINNCTTDNNCHHHFRREIIEEGNITDLHIEGKKNPGDICIRSLPRAHLNALNPLIFSQTFDYEAEKWW